MQSMDAFLRDIRFSLAEEALHRAQDRFVADMRRGLMGDAQGLPMLPAYLPLNDQSPRGDALVLDAGGTHLRLALMRLGPEGPRQLAYREMPMPGTAGRLSRTAFFRALAQATAPLASQADCIGFCFSFSAESLPDGDARVLYLDKELQVDGLSGALVGEGLLRALAEMGAPHRHRIAVLNDTTAALLGARAAQPQADARIGMILGTGFNCCYGEENARILKAEAIRTAPGRSIVNIEAGAFDGVEPSLADLLVRQESADAAQNPLEKMVSGVYQGPLLHALTRLAAEAGCFSAEGAAILAEAPVPTAADINAFAANPEAPGSLHDLLTTLEDCRALHALALALLQRTAALSAMVLRAVLTACDVPTDAPAAIAVEGSTYWKNPLLQRAFKAQLATADKPARILRAENCNLIGAALAALA